MCSKRFHPDITQSNPEPSPDSDDRVSSETASSQYLPYQSIGTIFDSPWSSSQPASFGAFNERQPYGNRQVRVDRVLILLRHRFLPIRSQSNGHLLLDKFTGDVVPEMVAAVEAPIAKDYRQRHTTEARRADIKRAFDHFAFPSQRTQCPVFFGRAGFNPQTRQRLIYAESGSCLAFDFNSSNYNSQPNHAFIQPYQSCPFPFPGNPGDWHPLLVNQLFEGTVLSSEFDLLLLAWMILCWMPDRKQVMLELLGAPSASLENAHALIRESVDPATVPWQNAIPRNTKEFKELALKHYLLSFNGVDKLSQAQQEQLFGLMRGRQIPWHWKGKKLDVEINVQCPVMLNALESVVTKSNLADATLSLEVGDAPKASSAQLAFMKPAILAGLLRIFGYVNSRWSFVEHEDRFNRYGGLADLCRVGELVAQSLGRNPADFWAQFGVNQQNRRQYELEESPVALAVQKLLEREGAGVIEMSVMDWLSSIEAYKPEDVDPDLWPMRTRKLGAMFKLVSPLLRDVGVNLTSLGRQGQHMYWRAEKAKGVAEPDGINESEKLDGDQQTGRVPESQSSGAGGSSQKSVVTISRKRRISVSIGKSG